MPFDRQQLVSERRVFAFSVHFITLKLEIVVIHLPNRNDT